jgi:hypothetical protein
MLGYKTVENVMYTRYPIQCGDVNLEEIMEGFQCQIQDFPCNSLGLPLHIRLIRRVEVQPLVNKMANILPT